VDGESSNNKIEQPSLSIPKEKWPLKNIYDGDVLFHGKKFQCIQKILGYDQQSLSAELYQASNVGQEQQQVVLMDGVLQACLLSAWPCLGGGSIPMSIGQISIYQKPITKSCQAYVRIVDSKKDKARFHAYLVDNKQEIILQCQNIELIKHFAKTFA
jgi:hypothetical protein